MGADEPARAVFELRLVGKPGQAGIHDLRALLKRWSAPRVCLARRPGKREHWCRFGIHLENPN